MIHICPSHQDIKTNRLNEKTTPPKQLMIPCHKAFLNIFQHLYKAWFISLLTITISIVYLDIKLRAQVVGMQKAGLSFCCFFLKIMSVRKTVTQICS
ncbi:hypothetical protein O181_108370 [Austropuccinia psidii MF-1]|uniref:Uncharacterized protein n=1 Tax=Austropuccinia psidii MF-1 TaxID=1389203 RepID=A0A9Q3PPI5_9BASI|nr:hypothetical protein [Austropuccinia psidii MF-1]